jgi:hypothetical protein
VLTFFIAGLLYLLCFEHVDNLGAYSIPSETGLLIPSGYVNNPLLACTKVCSTVVVQYLVELEQQTEAAQVHPMARKVPLLLPRFGRHSAC